MFSGAEGIFVAVSLVAVGAMSVSWIAFARLSMARIEREMCRDGLPRSSRWDGIGARVVWYAWAIVLPVGIANPADDPLIDVLTVRRYATRLDWLLGIAFLISGHLFLIPVLLGAFWFDFY